jgi:hypothetical protein
MFEHATERTTSSCRNHASSWFQLAKMRLTKVQVDFPSTPFIWPREIRQAAAAK